VCAAVVEDAGDEFLARAALAVDENAAVDIGHAEGRFENLLHGARDPDDLVDKVAVRLVDPPQRLDLVLAPVQGIADDLKEFPVVHGLHDVVESAHLDRLDDTVDGAEGRDDDHVQVGIVLLDPVQKADAKAVGRAQVGNDQVRDASLDKPHGLDLGGRFVNLVPFPAQQGGQSGPRRLVVVDNQNSFHPFRSPPITAAVSAAVILL